MTICQRSTWRHSTDWLQFYRRNHQKNQKPVKYLSFSLWSMTVSSTIYCGQREKGQIVPFWLSVVFGQFFQKGRKCSVTRSLVFSVFFGSDNGPYVRDGNTVYGMNRATGQPGSDNVLLRFFGCVMVGENFSTQWEETFGRISSHWDSPKT